MSDIDAPNTKVFSTSAAQTLSGGKKGGKAAQEADKGINFSEIMKNSGRSVSGGLNDISDRAGITAAGERSDGAPDMDDAPGRSSDNGGNNEDPNYDNNDRANQGNQAPAQSASQDDYGHQQADARPAEAKAEAGDNRQHAEHDNRGETAPGRDNQNADSGAGNEDAHASESKLAATNESGNDGNDKAAGDDGNAVQASKTDGKAVKTNVTTNAEQILNTLTASAQNSGLPGQAAEKVGQQGKAASAGNNAEAGLTKAEAVVANKANSGNAGSVQAETGLTRAQTASAGKANTGNASAGNANTVNASAGKANTGNAGAGQANAGEHAGQANANATAQANANANAQLQERTDKQANTVSQQAANLSKAIGNGNKVEVSVTVADEAKTLISRPTTTLASGAALASETGKPSLHAAQAQANQNATAGQAQLAAQAGIAQAQQAPQPVAGTQAQIINAASMDAKGMAQTGGLQNAASGGGETPTQATTNTAQATHQAQQSASAKAATAPRFSLPGQAAADQVSVQITKAINAGADKINIKLRPADLGRVDVKMEIAADGRVQAVITVDNKSTMDLLQRDSKTLEQALQDAGLEADSDSLSFNLRERQDNGGEAGQADASGSGLDADGEDANDGVIAAGERDIITDSRIDVRA